MRVREQPEPFQGCQFVANGGGAQPEPVAVGNAGAAHRLGRLDEFLHDQAQDLALAFGQRIDW